MALSLPSCTFFTLCFNNKSLIPTNNFFKRVAWDDIWEKEVLKNKKKLINIKPNNRTRPAHVPKNLCRGKDKAKPTTPPPSPDFAPFHNTSGVRKNFAIWINPFNDKIKSIKPK